MPATSSPPAAPRAGGRDAGRELAELVVAARGGDAAAWDCLVRRFDAIVRRTARSFRLQPVEVDDVVQATWLDLLENVDRIREPACTAAWLVTATRRRALRTLQLRTRELLCDDPREREPSEADGPQAHLIDAERRAALAGAMARLPPRHRTIMTLLLTDGAPDYKRISALADVPVGSIGPIRGRSLARLARDPALCAVR